MIEAMLWVAVAVPLWVLGVFMLSIATSAIADYFMAEDVDVDAAHAAGAAVLCLTLAAGSFYLAARLTF